MRVPDIARWRGRGGECFGLGLASFAANTRQSSGEKAGGDIDFAAFYILPVPSSLSAKWRRVKIGSLPSFSPSLRMPPKHPLRVRATVANWESTTIAPALRLGLRPRWICHLGGVLNLHLQCGKTAAPSSPLTGRAAILAAKFTAPPRAVLWYNNIVPRERCYGAKGRNPMRRKSICAAKRSSRET